MIMMRIHCGACGGTWEVYPKTRNLDPARVCPHCDKRIDGATWRDKVLSAYTEAQAANLALHADHVEYHTAPFTVDYLADTTFRNAADSNTTRAEMAQNRV